MKKNLLILTLFYLFTIANHAQNERKNWNDGKLTWNDFEEQNLELGGSLPAFYLTYKQVESKFKNTSINQIKAIGFINTKNSFVDPKYKTDQILYYHQVEFDILEYYRRKLQSELYNVKYFFNIESKHTEIKEQLLAELARFRIASHYGSNKSVLKKWEKEVSYKLQNTNSNSLPEILDRNFSYGVYAGIEYSSFSNSLNTAINPSPSLAFGFDFGWKKSFISLNASLVFIKLKKDLFLKEQLFKDKKYGLALANLNYGYSIIDNDKFRLIPFVGYGITEISERTKEENSFSTISYDIQYGINFDYKFKKILNLTPNFLDRKTKMEIYLRTRLYIAKSNFNSEFKGNTINIGFLFGGYERKIKLKK